MDRSAASFGYERELCDALASQLSRFESPRVRMRHQLQIGAEIPDFVVTLASAGAAPRISAIDSAIVAQLLDDGVLNTTSIASRLYTQTQRVTTCLARLRRAGLVVESASDKWTLTAKAGDDLLNSRVIAIEAKLTRWKDALAQAVSYQRFANLSFVALPLDVLRRRRQELRSDCQRHRIGLVGVGATELRIDVTPPAHHPRSADWVWTVMRMRLNEPRRMRETRSSNHADDLCSFAG